MGDDGFSKDVICFGFLSQGWFVVLWKEKKDFDPTCNVNTATLLGSAHFSNLFLASGVICWNMIETSNLIKVALAERGNY